MKQKIIAGISLLATVVFLSGLGILAFANPATGTDPLVTRSFLLDVFKPQVLAEASRMEQDLIDRLNVQIAELESRLQATQGTSGSASPGPADVFTVVTLRRNQSLTCSVGTEIMLRVGSANGAGTAPALVNYTTGAAHSAGSALVINNMYLVTIEGNGIQATADNTRVLVRGSYRIT